MVDDYYVCAYFIENTDSSKEVEAPKQAEREGGISVYDCDEGNIGISTEKDTIKLFGTMKKYTDSKIFYNLKKNNINNDKKENKEHVKITIFVPVYDAKKINDMNVVAMVKGEHQIKTIYVQDKSGKENNDKYKIPVKFILIGRQKLD
jgi:hypothetical protein